APSRLKRVGQLNIDRERVSLIDTSSGNTMRVSRRLNSAVEEVAMHRLPLWIVGLAAACDSGARQSSFSLTLASSGSVGTDAAPQIAMRAGETRTVDLIVMGTVPQPVTFEGENLPAFAPLAGSLLTLMPH